MRTTPRRLVAALALLSALPAAPSVADAITVARVTRRGYILTDDPGNEDFGDQMPAGNTREMYRFIQEATDSLSGYEGFRPGKYLASMQLPSTTDPLAYYLPIRNDVRGLGQRGADGRSETFDNNRALGTAFTLDGFLYLNSLRFYTDPRAVNYGRYLICTQEFGHRFGAFVETPAYPEAVLAAAQDAGAVGDGAVGDATAGDATAGDGAVGDAGPDAGPALPPALARDALLGRGNVTATGATINRSHWSYFFHSGGSPMEGNTWEETEPGTFRTGRPTFRFSEIDLYLMGLIPRTEVHPSFLIAEPQNVPRNISRNSPPEYYNRTVTIRGRRVDVTIDDIIRQNGSRVPAYPDAPRDMDVIWILWAPVDAVDDALADEFDEAIDSCSLGYSTATNNRSHLNAIVAPSPIVDAGPAPDDAGPRPDITLPEDITRPGTEDDAGATADAAVPDAGIPFDARAFDPAGGGSPSGCGCAVPGRGTSSRAAGLLALGLGLALASRRRRAR